MRTSIGTSGKSAFSLVSTNHIVDRAGGKFIAPSAVNLTFSIDRGAGEAVGTT